MLYDTRMSVGIPVFSRYYLYELERKLPLIVPGITITGLPPVAYWLDLEIVGVEWDIEKNRFDVEFKEIDESILRDLDISLELATEAETFLKLEQTFEDWKLAHLGLRRGTSEFRWVDPQTMKALKEDRGQ